MLDILLGTYRKCIAIKFASSIFVKGLLAGGCYGVIGIFSFFHLQSSKTYKGYAHDGQDNTNPIFYRKLLLKKDDA